MFYGGDWKNIKRTWKGKTCRFCKECVDESKTSRVKKCGRCGADKGENDFQIDDWKHTTRRNEDGEKCRFCKECVEKWKEETQ